MLEHYHNSALAAAYSHLVGTGKSVSVK